MTAPLLPPVHDAPLPRARPAAGGVRLLPGVPYAAIRGVRPLELDLWLPPEIDDAVPVVVFLHGGGWQAGTRHSAGPAYDGQDPNPFERVAQAGIAVASADYRLAGEAAWPAQLSDARAAVRWLRARSGELGLDPQRIAAWGESVGGHLAALLGLTGDDEALAGDVGVAGPSSAVVTVVTWYAPSDVPAVASDPGASPLAHVSPAAPPFLLLHGAADRLVPSVQSERLYAALVEAGAEVELDVYEDADHMWSGSPEAAATALDRTIDVLRRRLGVHRIGSGEGER